MIKNIQLTPHRVFVGLLALSLLGAYITRTAQDHCHYYWLLMLFVLGLAATAPAYLDNRNDRKSLQPRLLHWAGCVFATVVIYAYHNAGRLYHEETGLLILLVLAMGAYTDGLKSGRRFTVLGVFLGLIALSAAYVDAYLGPLTIAAGAAGTWSYLDGKALEQHSDGEMADEQPGQNGTAGQSSNL
ncbi:MULTISPECIES: hypothetical protein [Methylomicrobium]|uniref:Uncharacterized protein n=1 Tax=Methylomicrobium album BG8 TaxID=686340 RepID=H8GI54_METAL|nr:MULTISPECIES: hypothetical protein [Methylomicrobium]EIC30198.1 hypothetical protein Metal_2479 [Methylomicrobium album BG8]